MLEGSQEACTIDLKVLFGPGFDAGTSTKFAETVELSHHGTMATTLSLPKGPQHRDGGPTPQASSGLQPLWVMLSREWIARPRRVRKKRGME